MSSDAGWPEWVRAVLERFVDGVLELDGLAVYVGGSLAGGEFRDGVSDLDVVAIVANPVDAPAKAGLTALHDRLVEAEPRATLLGCLYVDAAASSDTEALHLARTHERWVRRRLTAVARTELHTAGVTLAGPPPAAFFPCPDAVELSADVVRELREYWLPRSYWPPIWLSAEWMELAATSAVRGLATVESGALISKEEAIRRLAKLGAPSGIRSLVVAGRRARPVEVSLLRRLAAAPGAWRFIRQTIKRATTARYPDGTTRILVDSE